MDKVAFTAKEKTLAGVKAGVGKKELAAIVADVYENYTKNQIEAAVSTLVSDVHNAARLELYKANKEFVPGVRYDAVLDEKTTVFCESHDGMTIALDSPDIEYLRPPNHFSCRAIYSPITILDGPFEQTWTMGDTYPDADFGGNILRGRA